jgi:16S rRNA processing protein RimM
MANERPDDLVLIGVVARAHGNRGQVIVNPETDFPEERFRVGRVFTVGREGSSSGRLTVSAVRFHRGRPVLGFEGVETMDAAEAMAGAELWLPASELAALPPGVYYHHELTGCEVRRGDGKLIGTVTRVEGPTAGSILVVDTRSGEVLVPLASEICVRIDPAQRTIVIEPPEGLIEVNERGGWRDGDER